LIIPSSVLWMGEDCFACCYSITSVVFESSTTGIYTIVEIKYGAFSSCAELSSATLPPTLERIPAHCFEDCTALIHVPIPPNVFELGEHSFEDCRSLPSMDLPESVDAIGRKAFLDCTALTTVTIRTRSLNFRMGEDIFRGCTALTTLRTYPWQWGKLLSSMKNDATFLQNFFNGTLTSLATINLNSWYGRHMLDAVKDQPSVLYCLLRNSSPPKRFETNAPWTTMTPHYTTDVVRRCGHEMGKDWIAYPQRTINGSYKLRFNRSKQKGTPS